MAGLVREFVYSTFIYGYVSKFGEFPYQEHIASVKDFHTMWRFHLNKSINLINFYLKLTWKSFV